MDCPIFDKRLFYLFFQSMGLGSSAKTSNNVSVGLERDATKTSQKIPELEEWLRRLEDLIKKIRDNFKTAGETLGEVKKPFPKFDDLTSKLGMFDEYYRDGDSNGGGGGGGDNDNRCLRNVIV